MEDLMTDRSASAVPDDAVIWHYTAFASWVSVLQKEKLWFTRLDKLRDPLEGRSEHPYKSDLRLKAEDHTRRGYVNCWTIDQEEADLMWLAFAPNFGVAIQSTKGRFRASLKAPEADEIKIDLVKYGTDWTVDEPETYAFLKRRHFKQEQELRAYIPYKYKNDAFGKTVESDVAGRSVSVEIGVLFQEVWVAPTSPDWFLTVVEEELAMYGYSAIQVRRRIG
jgi:hypothetical protein